MFSTPYKVFYMNKGEGLKEGHRVEHCNPSTHKNGLNSTDSTHFYEQILVSEIKFLL